MNDGMKLLLGLVAVSCLFFLFDCSGDAARLVP